MWGLVATYCLAVLVAWELLSLGLCYKETVAASWPLGEGGMWISQAYCSLTSLYFLYRDLV